jgi:acetyltransferase
MVKTLSRNSLTRLCHLDYDREMALVAVVHDEDGRPHIAGVSRYYLDTKTGIAEFAVVVSDRWQRQGLGLHLMECLIAAARKRGVKQLAGLILRENFPMQGLVHKLGFEIRPTDDYSVVEAVLDFSPKSM